MEKRTYTTTIVLYRFIDVTISDQISKSEKSTARATHTSLLGSSWTERHSTSNRIHSREFRDIVRETNLFCSEKRTVLMVTSTNLLLIGIAGVPDS